MPYQTIQNTHNYDSNYGQNFAHNKERRLPDLDSNLRCISFVVSLVPGQQAGGAEWDPGGAEGGAAESAGPRRRFDPLQSSG